MIVDFQSDGNTWSSSPSTSTRSFFSDNDDNPPETNNVPGYHAKNVSKTLSNQIHDIVIGEAASAHLDTLNTVFEGFPQNTAIEEGFKHKSRNEIAVDSTKNITPQLDEFLSKFLNLAIEDAVGLSYQNYGADFVIKKDSDEEEEEKSYKEKNEEEDNEDEYDKLSVADQEITINDKNEGKKPNLLNTIKSLFTKSKENETGVNNNSLNSSSSWSPKANIKRSNTVGPKSTSLFLNSSEDNSSLKTDDSINESEEKSKKKPIFKSFPFFKSKNNDDFQDLDDSDNKHNPKQISKTASSPKILFQNFFSPKSKEKDVDNNKTQHTVRFSNLDISKDSLDGNDSFQNEISTNDSTYEYDNQVSKPVIVENLEDFSSVSDSDSPRCRTPNSNPDISNQFFEELVDGEFESDEQVVKDLIRPPTPEKEYNDQFYSDSESKKNNKNANNTADSNSQVKQEIKNNNFHAEIEISFETDSSKKDDNSTNENNSKKGNALNPVPTNEPNSPSSQNSANRSYKDQDILLSASDSESYSENKVKYKVSTNQFAKKKKHNFEAVHLSSSSSEPETQKQEFISIKKTEEIEIEVNKKNNSKPNSPQTSSLKNKEIKFDLNTENEPENHLETKNKNKKEQIERVNILENIENDDSSRTSLQKGDSTRTALSNVDFIAHELSDFELEHQNLESDEYKSSKKDNNAVINPRRSSGTRPKIIRKSSSNLNEKEAAKLANTYSNKSNNTRKKSPKKNTNQSSQTQIIRGMPIRRKPNVIQENTSFEVFDSISKGRSKIKNRTINLSFNDYDEEEEINNRSIIKYRSSHNKTFSPKGRNSNSSSPHSNSPTYSPVHTHTHTPVPVKPRLILKNNSSSDDEYDDERNNNIKNSRKKPTPAKSRRNDSVTPKSKNVSFSSSSPSTPTKYRNSQISSSQNQNDLVVRKKKPYLSTSEINNEFYNDDDTFNVSIKINNENLNSKENDRRQKSDIGVNEKVYSSAPVKRVAKRKKRAASASSSMRIKSRNPQISTEKVENEDDEEALKKPAIKKTPRANPRRKRVQPKTLPRAQSRGASDTYLDHNEPFSEAQTAGQIRTVSPRKRRRLSVDEVAINRKNLAKNGVKGIIVIEFDKKTPIIENFLEQLSSNSGAGTRARSRSQSRTSSASRGSRRPTPLSEDSEVNQNESNNAVKARPKITKHAKTRSTSKMKKKVALVNDSSDSDGDNINNDDNIVIDFAESSSVAANKTRKKRQDSVKPSTLNRSSQQRKKNESFSDVGEKLTKTIDKQIVTESENFVIHRSLKSSTNSRRRRMASVKSEMGSRKNLDDDTDKYYDFNFKKLFEEAEKK